RRLTHYRSIRLSSSNARKPNTFLTSLGSRRFRNVTRLTSQVHETDISAKTVGETIFSSSDPEDNDCVTWRRTCFLPGGTARAVDRSPYPTCSILGDRHRS